MFLDATTGEPYCRAATPCYGLSCDCVKNEKKQASQRGHLEYAARILDRELKRTAINTVVEILKRNAPERLWEQRREIAKRATNLAAAGDIDSDLIANALLRSLFPKTY